MNRYIVLFIALWVLAVPSLSQEQGSIEVLVSGAKPSHGQAVLSLFNSSDNYLNEPIVSAHENIDANGKTVFRLSGLSNGDYAISVFYDEDENGKLNTGFLGIPTEFVGFSNNAKGSFGPPSYDQVKFKFTGSTKISINLGAVDE